MKISPAKLGRVAMAFSPFLLIELYLTRNGNTSISGICDLLYMSGWVCSILGLLQYNATGTAVGGRFILYLQLFLLGIANLWNIWTILDPGNKTFLYFILDFSWPASNVCLLTVGIWVAIAGVLGGWKRYVPLLAGLWLPFSISLFILFGQQPAVMIASGIYSAFTWFTMGLMIYSTAKENKLSNRGDTLFGKGFTLNF
jgi:hypothetical protein